jgi:MFS family permease
MNMEDSAHRDWKRQLPRWSGAAAMIGGLLCALAAVLHSLEPSGCIGAECDTRPMRSATALVSALGGAATLFIVIGMAGLIAMARRSGRHRKLANAGLITAVAGFAILFLGVLIQAVFFSGDLPWMPFFVIPGVIAVIAGFLLIGVFILRSGLLPRWLGIFLLVSSVLLLAANEQTAAVLFAVPFGLAVATVGFFMWTTGERASAGTSAHV